MLGFRGASRYVDEAFRPCFELECRALKRVREDMGLTNVQVMVPFVRTRRRGARRSRELLAAERPEARRDGLKIIMMCELPTNALLADQYLRVLRRHVDRLQRHDAAHARAGSRLGHRRARSSMSATRRCASCCRWRSSPAASNEQVHRHLRPGTVGSPGPRPLAARSGHREHVAQSGYGGRDLAVSRAAARRQQARAEATLGGAGELPARTAARGSDAARGSTRGCRHWPGARPA